MTHVRRFVSVVALSAAIAVAAAGCHKKVPQTAPAPPPAAPPTSPPTPPPPTPPPPKPTAPPAPLSDEEMFARKSLEELTRELSDAYFNYDKSDIREDARAPLQKDSDWMKKWTTTQVTVEGHCDPRGSSEYNLALGSRRATAVKDYLVNLGVPASRLTVVSKGKEQPICTDENESCWQRNRRGHLIVTAK